MKKPINIYSTFIGLLLFIFTPVFTNAQVFPVKIEGYVYFNNKPLENASVRLYHGNKMLKTLKSQDDGYFNVLPEINGKYTLQIAKKGFVPLIYSISTNMPDDFVMGEEKEVFDMGKVNMIKQSSVANIAAYREPVGKILYYKDQKKYGADEAYAKQFLTSLQGNANNNEDDNTADEKYNGFIKEGDNALKNDELNLAKDSYTKALELKPESNYPKEKLKEIENLLAQNSTDTEANGEEDIEDKSINQESNGGNLATDKGELEQLQEQLTEKENEGDEEGVADLSHKIGLILMNTGEADKAVDALKRALNIRMSLGGNEKAVDLLNDLAYANYEAENFDDALANFDEAASLLKSIGDKKAEAEMYFQMGGVNNDLFRYDNAIKNIEVGLELKKDEGDKIMESVLLNTLGNLYRDKGDYETAIEKYQTAFEYDKELGNHAEAAASLNNIGIAQFQLGNLDQAVEAYQQSIELLEELGKEKEISASLNNMGNVEYSKSQYIEALDFYSRSLEIKERLKYDKGIALSFHNIGNVHKMLEELIEALEYYNKSIYLAEANGMNELVSRNYEAISAIYYLQEDHKKAFEYYKLYSESDYSQFSKFGEGQLNELQPQKTIFDNNRLGKKDSTKINESKEKVLSIFLAKGRQAELSLKSAEIRERKNREKAQAMYKYYIIGGVILVLVILLLLYKISRDKKKHKLLS